MVNNRLAFRFTVPSTYTIAENEHFVIDLPTLTDLVPTNSASVSQTCVFQPTFSTRTQLGVGLYSRCSYSAGFYIVNAPLGGLLPSVEYTLSILE